MIRGLRGREESSGCQGLGERSCKNGFGDGKDCRWSFLLGQGKMSSVLAMLNLSFLDQIGSCIYEFGVQERRPK